MLTKAQQSHAFDQVQQLAHGGALAGSDLQVAGRKMLAFDGVMHGKILI